MRTRIEIDTKTFVRFWLVVISFVFAIFLVYLARTALVVLVSAAFLALALSGPVNRIRKIIPGRSQIGATAIAFSVVVCFLVAIIFLVVPPIVQQTVKLIDAAPDMLTTLTSQWHGLADLFAKYNIQPEIDQAIADLRHNTATWVSHSGQDVLSGVGSLLGGVAMVFLVLVLAFLMLVEGPDWLRRIWGLYEDQERMEVHRNLATRIHRVITGYVTGQLTVSSIGALAVGLVVFVLSLFIADVPANLALPAIAIAFILSLIPMFGSTIAGTLIAVLLLVNSPTAAIIFAIYFIVYQQIENNFISPTIQSKYVELSPLAVLAAVTVGLYVFGLAGGIISIPVAGTIKVLIEEYLIHARKVRQKSQRPLAKLVKKLQND
jgi:predicted PurR-regulated permease PerM